MSSQKIDPKSLNKLRNLYNSKLNELKSENEKLKFKLIDKKETLKLNQDLLIDVLQNFSPTKKGDELEDKDEEKKSGQNNNNNNIKTLIEKSKILNEKISLLIEEKSEKEKNIYLLKNEIPVIQEKIIEKINNISLQSAQKNKETQTQDSSIKKLKLELDKIRRNAFFKRARTEILVAPPCKTSVEMNLELINTQQIFSKASKLHQEKKKKSEEIWRKEKNLKDEMNKLKNSIINKKKIKKEETQNFFDDIGYDPLPEKYEKDEEEESEDDGQSSDDDNTTKRGVDNKKKEKELSMLKEETSKLKEKIKVYENKINEYKNIYRNYKSEIEKMKKDGKK